MLIVSLILLQLLIFVGLIVILRRIMTLNVISATRHLEELNEDYAKKGKEIHRQLEEIKQKSQEIVAKAQEEAEELKTKILDETQAEKEKLLAQARTQSGEIIQQAEKSRELLLAEIYERITNEAINKACELIHDTLPEKFRQDVHIHWIEELIEDGFSEFGNLHIPKDISQIKITSAFPLNEGQRKILFKKLKEVVKADIEIKEEIDPSIVAGLIVAIGSLVLDGSLKNKIQEHTKNI
ncbi:MAG: F0F1 ATP synthase subunit delta [Candidatus Omnitrophota bacterium]